MLQGQGQGITQQALTSYRHRKGMGRLITPLITSPPMLTPTSSSTKRHLATPLTWQVCTLLPPFLSISHVMLSHNSDSTLGCIVVQRPFVWIGPKVQPCFRPVQGLLKQHDLVRAHQANIITKQSSCTVSTDMFEVLCHYLGCFDAVTVHPDA